MKTEDFSFDLPPELIAQRPVEGKRDQCRLMVLSREKQAIAHRHFFELPQLLKSGDVLVMNDSKVFPARLIGQKATTKGKVEVLLLQRQQDKSEDIAEVWEALVSGKKVSEGLPLEFFVEDSTDEPLLKARVIERASDDTWYIDFNLADEQFRVALDQLGHTPIPPYIKRTPLNEKELRSEYQTVYAKAEGSAAAPTAGLHFTEDLLKQLTDAGIQQTTITLHVGLGTFSPVKVDDINNHTIHSEYAIITEQTAEMVNQAKMQGGRVIAVGTTAVRALETFTTDGHLKPGQQWTNLFITPGYSFSCVDAMITNFHLPRSTLLMMVAAFSDMDLMTAAYTEAIEREYRFYSFGDAMLIE